jgi:hypothetical protein
MSPNDSMQTVESAIKTRKQTNRCCKKENSCCYRQKFQAILILKQLMIQ